MIPPWPFTMLFNLQSLTVVKDDGVVIYSRRESATADSHAARTGLAARVALAVRQLLRSAYGYSLDVAANLHHGLKRSWSGLARMPASAKAAELTQGSQSYLSHASGLRIAGAACVHRVPTRSLGFR